ncbi:hypothetical protein, partial [Mycolicibacterium vanbaalenii]|uniref:hypothetical protein n=1 Tax=Mycolicibacterium vanbaalenii TaxID=110539 RepID=UPI0021F36FEC
MVSPRVIAAPNASRAARDGLGAVTSAALAAIVGLRVTAPMIVVAARPGFPDPFRIALAGTVVPFQGAAVGESALRRVGGQPGLVAAPGHPGVPRLRGEQGARGGLGGRGRRRGGQCRGRGVHQAEQQVGAVAAEPVLELTAQLRDVGGHCGDHRQQLHHPGHAQRVSGHRQAESGDGGQRAQRPGGQQRVVSGQGERAVPVAAGPGADATFGVGHDLCQVFGGSLGLGGDDDARHRAVDLGVPDPGDGVHGGEHLVGDRVGVGSAQAADLDPVVRVQPAAAFDGVAAERLGGDGGHGLHAAGAPAAASWTM